MEEDKPRRTCKVLSLVCTPNCLLRGCLCVLLTVSNDSCLCCVTHTSSPFILTSKSVTSRHFYHCQTSPPRALTIASSEWLQVSNYNINTCVDPDPKLLKYFSITLHKAHNSTHTNLTVNLITHSESKLRKRREAAS